MDKLDALIERVEKLTGPDREVDEAVAAALSLESWFVQFADAPEGTGCMMYRWTKYRNWESALRVTASLDAAVALVKRVLPGWDRLIRNDEAGGFCNLSNVADRRNPDAWIDGTTCFPTYAATEPLAIVLALLRAKAKEAQNV